jgi:hypothetical protein
LKEKGFTRILKIESKMIALFHPKYTDEQNKIVCKFLDDKTQTIDK